MKELDCLKRMFKLTHCYNDLVDFLLEEKLINDSQLTNLKLELDKAKFLYELIKKAEKDDKILLFSFDWVVLPVERIRIRLITERNTKELTHQY